MSEPKSRVRVAGSNSNVVWWDKVTRADAQHEVDTLILRDMLDRKAKKENGVKDVSENKRNKALQETLAQRFDVDGTEDEQVGRIKTARRRVQGGQSSQDLPELTGAIPLDWGYNLLSQAPPTPQVEASAESVVAHCTKPLEESGHSIKWDSVKDQYRVFSTSNAADEGSLHKYCETPFGEIFADLKNHLFLQQKDQSGNSSHGQIEASRNKQAEIPNKWTYLGMVAPPLKKGWEPHVDPVLTILRNKPVIHWSSASRRPFSLYGNGEEGSLTRGTV
ncbi:hypothetical protein T439DRAFT_368701 [Meredithblackwellia eburnea MCA 4105]